MKSNRVVRWGLICWLTYMSAYLCRVNFSASLTALATASEIDYALLGKAGAAFFVVYAVGQLINGFIGDHINPTAFIFAALCGTILCNVGVAFARSFFSICLLWATNGYFQSVFWSTIIRVLALTIPQDRRGAASAAISSAMPAGYLVSWCVLAPCFANTDVAWFFLMPALIALPMTGIWLHHRKTMAYAVKEQPSSGDLRKDIRSLARLVKDEHMIALLFACILHGLVKEGVGFWMPTIIRGVTSNTLVATVALMLFPAANFIGTVLAKKLLVPFGGKPKFIVVVSFATMVPLCIAVATAKDLWVLLPMCMISSLSYCANTVLMSYIPMQYLQKGFVASLVGLLDFCSYLGAAVATYVLGDMLEEYGVQGISMLWMIAACVAVILLMYHKGENRYDENSASSGSVSNAV